MHNSLVIDYVTHLLDRVDELRKKLQGEDSQIENQILNPIMGELSDAAHCIEHVHLMVAGECECNHNHNPEDE